MKKILAGLFAIMAALPLTAQSLETVAEKELPHLEKRFTIAAHPLYLHYNGLRLDVEKRIKNTPSWIQLGIAGHLMPESDDGYNYIFIPSGDEFNNLKGVGLELNYKRFVNRIETLYFAGGCSYSHYDVGYTDNFWNSYTEDGLTYMTRERGNIKQQINKLGISTYFGYQFPKPVFLIDLFIGLGYRYSFRSNSMARPFNDRMLSLGYRGFVFITGARLGVKFK
jgi:hypothetical protein